MPRTAVPFTSHLPTALIEWLSKTKMMSRLYICQLQHHQEQEKILGMNATGQKGICK
jgi:hypothetical protein